MKKNIFFLLMTVVFVTTANAQKTTSYNYEDTQARALDIKATGYVKPLVNEVKVDATRGRQKFVIEMSKDFVEGDMKGDIDNVRSYGVFRASEKWNCDIVVAPTFHLFTNEKGGYTLEVLGFAGMFVNWCTMTEADMVWINSAQPNSIEDKQIEPATKPIKIR